MHTTMEYPVCTLSVQVKANLVKMDICMHMLMFLVNADDCKPQLSSTAKAYQRKLTLQGFAADSPYLRVCQTA